MNAQTIQALREPDLLRSDPWPESKLMGPEQGVPAGTVLFRQNDAVRLLYLVILGCVKLTASDDQGREVLVALRLPGWLLATAAAVLGLPHPVSAEALGPCEVRSIPVAQFRRLQKTDLAVVHWVQRMQSREAYEQVSQLSMLGGSDSTVRLERLLVRLVQAGYDRRRDGSLRLTTPLRHEDMAHAIGTTRETVSRLLARLERRGELHREGGWIIFPKQSRLARAVDIEK
jgi:CRP-like cAMP-binding protein